MKLGDALTLVLAMSEAHYANHLNYDGKLYHAAELKDAQNTVEDFIVNHVEEDGSIEGLTEVDITGLCKQE